MRMQLLTGVAALALVAAGTAAMAQENEAEDNEAVTLTQNAVEEGALTAGDGNAVASDVDGAATAYWKSTAVQVDEAEAVATNNSLAAENGAVVGDDGVAVGEDGDDNAVVGGSGVAINIENGELVDEGSALLIGHGNSAAAAEDESASANFGSTVIYSQEGDIADNGSAVVIGKGNTTAATEEGASVGGNGTAVGINDIDVFTDDITTAFGEGNVVASAHLTEVNTSSITLDVFLDALATLDLDASLGELLGVNLPDIENGDLVGLLEDFFAGEISVEDLAELLELDVSVVQALIAELELNVLAQLQLQVAANVGGAIAVGPNATISTGDITGQHIGSLTGANMIAANTGIANQGDAIGVAAQNSF